jgi:hypothetical protein
VPATLPEVGMFGSKLALCRSASVDGGAAVEEGNAGIPGADCTPGIPGKDDNSLNDGSDVAEPGYAAFPVSAKVPDEPVVLVDGTPGTSGDALAGTAGVTAFASWGCATPAAVVVEASGGAAEDDDGGAGAFGMVSMPGTLGIAGTRGKENRSLIGGNTDAAAGEVPFSPPTK